MLGPSNNNQGDAAGWLSSPLAVLVSTCMAAAVGSAAVVLHSQRHTMVRQARITTQLRAAIRERLRASLRCKAAALIQLEWRNTLLLRWAVLCVQAYARRYLVARRLDDESAQCELDNFFESFDGGYRCCANIDYDQVRGHRYHGSSVHKLPHVVWGLAWFRGQVCIIQAAARGLLGRGLIRPWVALASKLPAGTVLSKVIWLRIILGRRPDVVCAHRDSHGRLLRGAAKGPFDAIIRDHVEAVRERPPAPKKATSAKKQKARKAAAIVKKERGSPGKTVEVNGVLYYIKGWNQLPLQLLRKRWLLGPLGSGSLSREAAFYLSMLTVGSDGSSDSEEDDGSHIRARLAGVRA